MQVKLRMNMNEFLLYYILWIIFLTTFIIGRFWGTDDIFLGKFPIRLDNGFALVIILGLFLAITDWSLSLLATIPSISKIPYFYVLAAKLIALASIFAIVQSFLRLAMYFHLSGVEKEYLLNSFFSYFSSGRALSIIVLIIIFSFFVNLIVKMKELIGGDVLFNLLMGRYRIPRIEKRIFMFLDLKDSTTHAERLGDAKYSQLIQDVFDDLNEIVIQKSATIVKFVGDEVILLWDLKNGMKDNNCIRFYFSYMNKLVSRTKYYTHKYHLVPEFKAGIHVGEATIVEIGKTRKEIAYISDTLNTTARLQGECNIQKQKLLVSKELKEMMNRRSKTKKINFERVGFIALKGKKKPADVYTVKATDV